MTLRLSEEEYAELMRRRRGKRSGEQGTGIAGADGVKRRKYGNTPVTVDGKRFDSRHVCG